ncbi:hypothetical protein [Nonomuraea angiospora]
MEKQTGWKCAIIDTNLGSRALRGVPGSHHDQFAGAVHRDHAEVADWGEDARRLQRTSSTVRTNKAMGLGNLPSKTWNVNVGWVLAADIDAWTRLLRLHDDARLTCAEPHTLRAACGTWSPAPASAP